MTVNLGDTVLIKVTSGVADEVHLHGYDISSGVDAGHDAEILFEASVPGIFEVERRCAVATNGADSAVRSIPTRRRNSR